MMRFWEDMTSKWGFNDGEAVPAEAAQAREIYVRFINERAKRHKSKFRAVSFNRPGVHNWCLIVIVAEKAARKFDLLSGDEGYRAFNGGKGITAVQTTDEGFQTALEEAHDAGLDDLLDIDIKINHDELRSTLARMK